MDRLAGKVAIVTGAARGMGAATARLFAAEGARVILTDVLDEEGRAVAREIGGAAFFQHHDVREEASWQQLLANAVARFERVDVLVNNAAVLSVRSLVEMDKRDFDRVVAVNLTGVFLGIKTAAPWMIEGGKGAIVNISSISGMIGQMGMVAYAASKWGVRGLTHVAALELGPRGVRVNSVHPGPINTVMSVPRGMSLEEVKPFWTNLPLQRIGQPEEVAHVSLFLASDESSYVCGAEFVVDGGMLVGSYCQPQLDAAASHEPIT